MQCIRPLKAGFDRLGNITYNNKKISKELVGIQFECRKCLPCRLNIAREKSIRALHEAKCHDNNIFLTLTYDDEHLESPRLIYSHFQNFMKNLRHTQSDPISYMVTGEYGEEKKRPHWHAILFNYEPSDGKKKYTSDLGDEVRSSGLLGDLWAMGAHEYGNVTLESASYVARYSAKKLVHGKDGAHDYHPIHKTSSKHAIGKRWIEKNYKHVFENGFVVLPNGTQAKIPRYYVDWLKKEKPEMWTDYVTQLRPQIQKAAQEKSRKELEYYIHQVEVLKNLQPFPLSRSKVKETILKSKFKQLQERLKL